MKLHHIAALCGGILLATSAFAAGRFDDITVSDQPDGDAVDSFPPSAAKVFVYAHMVDIPTGSKMKSAWVAVDTHGVAPANYVIDSAELTADGKVNVVTFNLSKPTAGWPLGHYRVDLTIDGKAAGSPEFDIEKQ